MTRFVAVSLAALILSACGVGTAAQAPAKTVRGILVEVESASLQKLDAFTLRTDDGTEITFMAAANFNEGAAHPMTPGHLRQHMALAEPVTVSYREENGTLVALSATD